MFKQPLGLTHILMMIVVAFVVAIPPTMHLLPASFAMQLRVAALSAALLVFAGLLLAGVVKMLLHALPASESNSSVRPNVESVNTRQPAIG